MDVIKVGGRAVFFHIEGSWYCLPSSYWLPASEHKDITVVRAPARVVQPVPSPTLQEVTRNLVAERHAFDVVGSAMFVLDEGNFVISGTPLQIILDAGVFYMRWAPVGWFFRVLSGSAWVPLTYGTRIPEKLRGVQLVVVKLERAMDFLVSIKSDDGTLAVRSSVLRGLKVGTQLRGTRALWASIFSKHTWDMTPLTEEEALLLSRFTTTSGTHK
jgi:hypothetical protein